MSGVCRSLIVYLDNSRNRRTVAGTHTNLYFVGEDNAVTDITPSGFTTGSANAVQNLGYGGLTWGEIGPSKIDASSAPGLLKRLESGRLVLVWNRYFPEGQTEFPLTGGDRQWSEVPVSNHRLELSLMFSDDDGRKWSDPVVIARIARGSLAYPYLFEAEPGELWITTMQGGLRVKLKEQDFVGP